MNRRAAVAIGLGVGVAVVMTAPVGAAPSREREAVVAVRPDRALPPNFVSNCAYSHSASDDPIVFPGQPGASHLHDFFANTTTAAGSTAASLGTGGTTCRRRSDTAAYWAPALRESGRTVRPSKVAAYYQLDGKDPATIKAFPAGLRVVAGPAPGRAEFGCAGNRPRVASSITTVPTCPAGQDLVVRIFFPDCWDGRNVDSADHRSHMAYNSAGTCPASHPVPVPRLRLGFHYAGSDGGADATLSSGSAATAHADFFNTWNQAELERLVTRCLNTRVHCGARGPGRPLGR